MTLLIIVLGLAVAASAAPPPPQPDSDDDGVQLLYEMNEQPDPQSYTFSFATSDGTSRREEGRDEGAGLVVRGSYSWEAPDGVTYTVQYEADERGYRPVLTTRRAIIAILESGQLPPSVVASLLGK